MHAEQVLYIAHARCAHALTFTDGSGECLKRVESSLPIGVGEPCPLVPQVLPTPPHSIEFLVRWL